LIRKKYEAGYANKLCFNTKKTGIIT